MFDSKKFDEIAKKLTDILPAGVKEVKADLEKNFKSILQSAFSKLDLVTREEFDVQVNVLVRTRKKIDALEKKLAKLEKGSKKSSGTGTKGKK